MSRLPIRARLTLAFAAAMALVLLLAGIFVYVRVKSDIESSVDEGLQSRVDDLAGRIETRGTTGLELAVARGEGGEDFLTQVLTPDGKVLASTAGQSGTAVLDSSQLSAAQNDPTYFDANAVPGIDEGARLLAESVDTGSSSVVVVAGVSTGDRKETLNGLAKTLALGAPIALLLASALGYALATLGIKPVEAMRVRAGEITLQRGGERLPLPRSDDEIARLGRTLNDMLARLEESMERERSFVADAGHELRTPLAVLRGELELALRPGRSEAQRTTAMKAAIEEADRLQQLSNSLIASASSDAERISLQRSEVNVEEVLAKSRSRLVRKASQMNREIALSVPAGLVWSLDPRRIESAVENLIENSLKHGEGRIEVKAAADGDDVVIGVSDEGPGFPEDFAGRAFDRFARAEASRTTEGTGLGLAIVRAIAEAHGGSARIVPTTPGGGSRVEIVLPGA